MRFIAGFILLLALAFPANALPQPQPATFGVADNQLKLAPGGSQGGGAFTVDLTGDLADQDCQLKLDALPASGTRSRDTLAATPLSIQPKSRSWLVTVSDISKAGPPGPEDRRFVATYCNYKKLLVYTIDNSYPDDFSWSVTVPKARRWDGEGLIPISISVGPRPATEVRLMVPELYWDLHTTKTSWVLCETETRCAGAPLTLAANKVHDLWIARRPGEALAAGKYGGTIKVVAAEKPEGDGFEAEFHVSRPELVWLGVALIVAGVILAGFVVQWLRRTADRLALARPVAQLKDQLAELELAVAETGSGPSFRHLGPAIVNEKNALDGADRFLPAQWAFWPQPDNQAAYQAFLTLHSNRIGSLAIIFQGLKQAMAEAWPNRAPDELKIVDAAIAKIDALAASDLSNRDAISTSVRDLLKAMANDLAAASGKQLDEAGAVPRSVNYSSERLSFQLALVNAGGFFIFAILSSLLGVYVLIANDPNFGEPKDLLLCFLWGFGLPTAGQGLANVTAPAVAQSLGVTLTRA